MECRRTLQGTDVAGALRSPPSAKRAPQQPQLQLQRQQSHQLHRRRRLHDCSDEYNNNNNNNDINHSFNVSSTSANNSVTTTTTLLVDELEQLRTDNFQLRLRVYNAERRVDRLSAAATIEHDRNKCTSDSDSETSTSSGGSGSSSSANDDAANAQTAAAATATAAAAVRTIHDLLTVNKRLLALLAATVSAKAVALSADDKRRWRRLRNHIENHAASDQSDGEVDEEEESQQDDDGDDSDASTTYSETCTARVQTQKASAEHSMPAGTRLLAPRSPPPPPEPDRLPAPEDDSAGSELSRLRARCRRLERSLQQLVNTELWARNRQIGKLEQQRYVTQVARDAGAQSERGRPAAVAQQQQQQSTRPATTTKGILVMRSPETHVASSEVTAAAAAITTPPPVLPDYSEVNFFFSCDEEEDDDQGNSETNTLSSASMDEETESDDVRPRGKLPVRSAAIRAEVNAPVVQPRKRQCRPHHRPQQQQQQQQQRQCAAVVEAATTTSSSSTDCAAAVANGSKASDLSGGGRATPPTLSSRPPRHRTFSGTGRQRPRRRYRPRRCSGCARRGADDGLWVPAARAPVAVADAQVQCSDDDEGAATDGRDDDRAMLVQLRRELDARRRENCRLYDMLLRRRRGRDGPKASFLEDGDDAATDSNADDGDGSPEPYRRAARAVRGRIADLLPPLLSMRSTEDEDYGDGGVERRRRLQQVDDRQAKTLARLRERIVAYERQELDGDRVSLQTSEDQEDDVLSMDRAALVNVALPRAVDRLRRAILQRLPEEQQQQQQPDGQEDPTADQRTLQLQQLSADCNGDRHRVER